MNKPFRIGSLLAVFFIYSALILPAPAHPWGWATHVYLMENLGPTNEASFYDPFWWIKDPGGIFTNPAQNVLTQEEDWIAFIPGSMVGAAGVAVDHVNLYAKGLGIRLYDYTQTELLLLREGVAGSGFTPAPGAGPALGETLDTRGLVLGKEYLLQIYRSMGGEDPIDGSTPVWPQVPYTVEAVF